MGRLIVEPLAEGFFDALRLFSLIILGPFRALWAFVRHDELAWWGRDAEITSSSSERLQHL